MLLVENRTDHHLKMQLAKNLQHTTTDNGTI